MKRSNDDAHGMSARETAIMDLADIGVETADIAVELGLAPTYVAQVRAMYSYSNCWSAGSAFDAMARAGTIALARAIAATGGRFA